MPFELSNFLLGSAIIENQGVSRDEARRLGVLPALLNLPLAQSLLIATTIGRNNAQPPPSSSPEINPSNGQPPQNISVPDFSGMTIDQVTAQIEKDGSVSLKVVTCPDSPGANATMVQQVPGAETSVSPNTLVALFFSSGQ